MIIELLRKRIKTSGKSLNQIGRETGIDKAALSRIMQGGSCKVETADILLKYFGVKLVPEKRKRKAKKQHKGKICRKKKRTVGSPYDGA
jgi:transcriptional regulator with XRE-family HTH domain